MPQELDTIKPREGIRDRALAIMKDSEGNTASDLEGEGLKLTPLKDIPRLKNEMIRLMELIVRRRRIQIVVSGNHSKGKINIPDNEAALAAVRLSRKPVFDGIKVDTTLQNDKNKPYTAWVDLFDCLSNKYDKPDLPLFYKFFCSFFRISPNLVQSKVYSIYEAIQFCYAMHENGLIQYENGVTTRQKKQGELLVRMAQVYAQDLSEIMVETEASMASSQLMPGFQEEALVQRLAELKDDSLRVLSATIRMVEDIDLAQIALAEANGDRDTLSEDIAALPQPE